MNAKFVKTSLLTTLLVVLHTTVSAQTYCQPNVQMACFYGDQITRVVFAGIDHTDAVCDVDADGKKDFTTTVAAAQVTRGSGYTLTVTFSVNNSVGAFAWLDFNDDGTFQTTEAFNLGTRTSNGTLSTTITIPAGASIGSTRLRVMNRKNNVNPGPTAADACHSISNYRGQMKDYAVTISGGSLPVELSRFDLTKNGRSVSLSWTTESELDNDHFLVERSTDAVNWTFLAEKKGKGNSSEQQQYALEDVAPEAGINYYRLSQQDKNGKLTLLEVESVLPDRPMTTVYPNPFSDVLLLEKAERGAEILLFDNTWQLQNRQLVPEAKTEEPLEIALGELKAGVYFLVIRTISGEECHKLIKL